MNSRRVHRVRTAQRQALGVLETYQQSSRGLMRVFDSILPPSDPSRGAAAARCAHHLAEVEAMLPRIREAIRSCRYPGAESGDPTALLWGLWGQLSEAHLHFRGALDSLQVLGRLTRPSAGTTAPAAGGKPKSASRTARPRPKKGAGKASKKRKARRRSGR